MMIKLFLVGLLLVLPNLTIGQDLRQRYVLPIVVQELIEKPDKPLGQYESKRKACFNIFKELDTAISKGVISKYSQLSSELNECYKASLELRHQFAPAWVALVNLEFLPADALSERGWKQVDSWRKMYSETCSKLVKIQNSYKSDEDIEKIIARARELLRNTASSKAGFFYWSFIVRDVRTVVMAL